MLKFLIPVFFLFILIACRKTSSSSFDKSFPGFYKIVKITSATPVDLNNDGVKSTNVYGEISNPYKTPNGDLFSFHDFQAQQNYMEVRPLPDQITDAKLITFNYPHQIIDSLSNGTPFLVEYNNEFIHYTYKINDDKNILVASVNPGYTNQIGEINSVMVKENGVLEVLLEKQVFDFVDKAWKQVSISAQYTKIP